MKTVLLLALLSLPSFALELSIDSAKDNFIPYSTLKLSGEKPFLCQAEKDDFEVTTEIICAFSNRPSHKIANLQNNFFKVKTFYKNDTFFLSIKPFYKIKLIAQIFNLTEDDSVYSVDVTLSKIWLIIGYKDRLPLINNRKKPSLSLNFPFYSDRDTMPYVGSLDLNNNPVYIKEVGDVRDYLRVKSLYKKKNYAQSLELIGDIMREYPHTLFKAELTYYKIKVYEKLQEYDNVVDNAKIYLKEYSGSENIAEVLALIAQAYSKIDMNSDADYFFDRLFSEHKNSIFAQWGYIYKGEMLASEGNITPALKFYKKALYQTNDLEVAAHAAYDIANVRLDTNSKDAAKYVDKIISAKPSYFSEEYKNSLFMMNTFADDSNYITAAKIAHALVDSLGITNDDYEKLLSKWALWLAKTPNKAEALVALNRYLKEFPDGDYLDAVQTAKDGLFFETSDSNLTVKLAEYNKLIDTYAHDTIGERAVYEKAKLLLKNKMYSDVLSMQDALHSLDEKYDDIDIIIGSAATGLMEISLKNKKCKEVLIIAHDYNITLSDSWDDGIYDCAMKGGDYQLSKKIAEKNFQSSKLDFRKKWLYRYIKVDFTTGNYSDVVGASKDLIKLIKGEKNSPYKDVYRYLFDTYSRLERKDLLLPSMLRIEKAFGINYKDIGRYVTMMRLGHDTKDDNLVINYGKKVEKIQNQSSSHSQSPYVEFTLYQAYMDLEKYTKALNIIKSLDNIKLTKTKRARAEYLKGMVLMKLWRDEEAQKAYDAAIKADSESPWAKLAKSAKEL